MDELSVSIPMYRPNSLNRDPDLPIESRKGRLRVAQDELGFNRSRRGGLAELALPVRLGPRVGPVLNLVRYQDGDRLRSVMYEGSLSDMYVPYMDPDDGWETLE